MFTYDNFNRHLHDKDVFVNDLANRLLNMTSAMFEYKGLPDTIPTSQLERQLQTNGSVGVIKHRGKLYALSGSPVTVGVYNEPLDYQISNTYLNLSQIYDVGKNVSIVKNDTYMTGIIPIIAKYAVTICDTEISLDTIAILARITMLISAPDDKTKQAADIFLEKINAGEFSVIGDNAFFNGVKLSSPSTQSTARVTDIIELLQYYKASMFNELGLQANWNGKRENLSETEVGMNVDVLLPFADDMLRERQAGVELVNQMFGTEITVDFGSVWKTNNESKQAENAIVDTDENDDSDPINTVDENEGGESNEDV